jgi:hypothetical protein
MPASLPDFSMRADCWRQTESKVTFRFLTPVTHGLLDYIAAAVLITAPTALDLGVESQVAMWLSVAGGLLITTYSALTDYDWGSYALLPFRVHLALDLLVAAAFAAAPFVFGWFGLVQSYYLVMAAGLLAVVVCTRDDEAAIFIRTDSANAE